MTTRMTKPPYILAHIADTAGCGHHRIMRPMEIMSKLGYCAGRSDMNLWSDDRLKALNPDVVVWQRQVEDHQIKVIEKYRRVLPHAFFVYEIDDIMSAVPEWSPHRSFITPDIDERMARAISLCDAVTVTTWPLRDHIRRICATDVDVRVVPNMLGLDELQRVEEICNMKPKTGDKLRIGWGGGFSHSGDLNLIIPAIREFHNRVEFVFLGQKPDFEVPVESHGGVAPPEFLSKLASLGLDLILAPLVSCIFNECKSNLRLLEAAALSVPVIASPVYPYRTESPPVRYAADQQDWIDKIGEFVERPDHYRHYGKLLNKWLHQHYVFDTHVEKRIRGWLPKDIAPFVPKPHAGPKGVTLVVPDAGAFRNSKNSITSNFVEALSSDDDIIYVRNGVLMTDAQVERLVTHLRQGNRAAAVPMSNEGGATGFPQTQQFTPIETMPFAKVDELCVSLFTGFTAELGNPNGPVMALSRRALQICGFPDMTYSDIETSLVEWGVMAASKGFSTVAVPEVYVPSLFPPKPSDVYALMTRCQLRYPMKQYAPDPLAPIRQELELAYHKNFYKAPMPSSNVTYTEWSALFNEIGPRDKAWFAEHPPVTKVIHYTYPISLENVNEAADWVVFTAEGTRLVDHALYVFASEIDKNPGAFLIYADHDHIQPGGLFDRHDFKPHRVDRLLFVQRDYITPVFAVNMRALFAAHDGDILSEISLYKTLLRCLNNHWDDVHVVHIPRILAHVVERAVVHMLEMTTVKTGIASQVMELDIQPNSRFPALGEVSFSSHHSDPRISIIMPTGGRLEMIAPALTSLLDITTYTNFEVIVIENGMFNSDCHAFLEDLAKRDKRISLRHYPEPYNWSAINNWAARLALGEFLLLLNDDTRFHVPEWLDEMVGAAQLRGVGAVGARLIYPNGLVQHVGVVVRGGFSGHLHKGLPESSPGYNGIAAVSHEATAVTGACLLIKADLFNEVGGLDERLVHNFNDVALCLELDKRGYRNIVAAKAVVQHLEGMTRLSSISEEGAKILHAEGMLLTSMYSGPDPYWNENLFFAHTENGVYVSGLNCDRLQWPSPPWFWRTDNWEQETVLLIGDDGSAWVDHARRGDVLYFAMLSGFSMQIVRPTLVNVQPFDIRELDAPREVLVKLGVSKIIVRSILGGTAEVLSFFANLNVPIEYRPNTNEAVCARLDMKTRLPTGELGDCNAGYKRGLCQQCVEGAGSPFGAVSVVGWRDQWRRFLGKADVVIAKDDLAAATLSEVYDIRVDYADV